MLSLFFPVCILPLVDFNTRKYAALYNFTFRLMITLIIGFGIIFHAPVWVKIVVAIFIMIMLSILATVTLEKQLFITAFCLFSLLFGFFMGVFIYRGVWVTESGQLHSILIIISILSVLAYFLLNNVNTVRWFSDHRLGIPGSMKRLSIILLSVLCVLISFISFSPWILRAIEAFLSGVVRLIRSLTDLLMNFMQTPALSQPESGSGFLPVQDRKSVV